jgi:predicted nucleotidyltransferase
MQIEANIKKTIIDILSSNSIAFQSISLFGSRARKDNDSDSDFDIMIITEKDIKRDIKFRILKIIRQRLALLYIKSGLIAGTDVVMKSVKEIEYYKNKPGSLVKNAVKESVEL